MKIPSAIPFLIITIAIVACKPNKKSSSLEYLASKSPMSIKTVSTIAFGSCNHEDDPQTHWQEIAKNNPDLWIWGGDNIYGSADLDILKTKYDYLKQNSLYQKFRNEVPVIGTWDDHDYGMNDGNKTYSLKTESKTLMLDFLDVPATSEVYNHEGCYMSYLFGQAGRKVKVILLDTRTFQDRLDKNPSGKSRYLPSREKDILGRQQWEWLEQELYNNEAEVHIIMSSIQFLADQHGYEKWANFPKSKERLISMIHYSNANNVMFLSGDRHIGEVSRIVVDSINYPIYDVTSSGLTHSYTKSKEANPYRIGDLVVDKNYGIINFEWQDSTVSIQCLIKGMEGQTFVDEQIEYKLH